MKKMYEFSSLFSYDFVWKEIDNYILGYHLDNVSFYDNMYNCTFFNEIGKIMLIIKEDSISLTKVSNDEIQVVNIKSNLILKERKIEKRENGILVTDIRKRFLPSKKYKSIILKNIYEKRMVFTKKNLNKIFKNLDFDNDSLMHLNLRLSLIKNKLSEICDLYNVFSTHMSDNSNRTFINSEDITDLYEFIDGPNRLYEIYNLYKGKMERNIKNDIIAIRLNLLSEKSYNLIEKLGIIEKEENLIGKSKQEEEIIKVYDLKKH